MKKNLIANAIVVAKNQYHQFNLNGEYPKDAVSFDCLDQTIINPFMDVSGRFELSLDAAYAYYGRYNMEYFIKEAYKKCLEETFMKNYISQDYNYDCGTFEISFDEKEYDIKLVFTFTHYTGDKYELYAHLDEIGVLYILNDRGENILDYAENYEWTEEDVKTIKYGPIERMPLDKIELIHLGFKFLNKISQTHMEIFKLGENLYSIEYYGKKEFGHPDEVIFFGTKEEIEERFA